MNFLGTLEELHALYGVPGPASTRKEAPRRRWGGGRGGSGSVGWRRLTRGARGAFGGAAARGSFCGNRGGGGGGHHRGFSARGLCRGREF